MNIKNILVSGGFAVATAVGLIFAGAGFAQSADDSVGTADIVQTFDTVAVDDAVIVAGFDNDTQLVADFKHALQMANEVRIAMQRRVNDADAWFDMFGTHYPNRVFRAADVQFRDDLVDAIATAENILTENADNEVVLREALDALVAVYEPNGPYPNFENIPASWLSVLPNGDPRNLPWFSTALIGPETVRYSANPFFGQGADLGITVTGSIQCSGPTGLINANCRPTSRRPDSFIQQFTYVNIDELNIPISLHDEYTFIGQQPERRNTCVAVRQSVSNPIIEGISFDTWGVESNALIGGISDRFLQRDDNGFVVFEWDKSDACVELRESRGLDDSFLSPGTMNTFWRYNLGPSDDSFRMLGNDQTTIDTILNVVGGEFDETFTFDSGPFVIE